MVVELSWNHTRIVRYESGFLGLIERKVMLKSTVCLGNRGLPGVFFILCADDFRYYMLPNRELLKNILQIDLLPQVSSVFKTLAFFQSGAYLHHSYFK